MSRIERICKNCKHCVPNEVYAEKYGLGCNSPKTEATYSLNEPPEGGILVENDEGWGIIVSHTFGCVNFEMKATRRKIGKKSKRPDKRPARLRYWLSR